MNFELDFIQARLFKFLENREEKNWKKLCNGNGNIELLSVNKTKLRLLLGLKTVTHDKNTGIANTNCHNYRT